MKILLIHNNYGTYSGEEAVVDKQLALFRSMGHDVDVLKRDSAAFRNSLVGNMKGFFTGFYSSDAVKEVKQRLETKKPDVVVIHNLYPFISPAILPFIKQAGVPVIMTVHNYRLICPTGLFMRNFKPCELCLGHSEWNCVRYNCEYSLPKSIAYAGRNWYARKSGAYFDNVDRYACITRFQSEKLIQAGYPGDKMRILPNFLDKIVPYEKKEGTYVAISGRLSQEKGIDLILKAAEQLPHISFVFAGGKRDDCHLPDQIPANCTFLGHISQDALSCFYSSAKFLLIGSLCYEGFPMTILEAASKGKPAIGPAHAGFLEVIDNERTGLHFTPGNASDMGEKIARLWDDDEACNSMGNRAYEKLKTEYSSEILNLKWQQLFDEVVNIS